MVIVARVKDTCEDSSMDHATVSIITLVLTIIILFILVVPGIRR